MNIKKIILGLSLAYSFFVSGENNTKAMEFNESYNYLMEHDYIRNYSTGEYLPYQNIKREEAAWLLSLSLYDSKFESNPNISFADVAEASFYGPYIEKMKRLNVINGTTNGKFNPYNELSRYQAVAILNRAFNIKLKPNNKRCFKDIPKKHWAESDICALKDLGIINGSNGKFNGSNSITKAQFTMMYARMIKKEFYIDEIDYKFEKEIIDNFYFHNGKKLTKVDFKKKIPLERIQKILKIDKALKEQKEFLGQDLEKLMEIEPLSFALTKSEFIAKNGGVYHHHEVTNAGVYFDNAPKTNLIAVANNFNTDHSFRSIFTHELGHYLGYSALHIKYDYSGLNQFKNIDIFTPGKKYIKGWGDDTMEAFADSYIEIAIDGFENRTYVGNFKSTENKKKFDVWIRNKIKERIENKNHAVN